MKKKTCTRCLIAKPVGEFSPSKISKDKRQPVCKICRRVDTRKDYHKHHEKRLYTRHLYRKNNKRFVALTSRAVRVNERAAEWGSKGILTALMLEYMFVDQSGLCYYCTKPLRKEWHLDHKTPFSRGGQNTLENVCAACPPCNRMKMSMTEDEYRMLGEST